MSTSLQRLVVGWLAGIGLAFIFIAAACISTALVTLTYRYFVEQAGEQVRCVEFDRPSILDGRECVRWQRFTTAGKP